MTDEQQKTRKLDCLASLCKAEGMQVWITRDPGIRICPKGPRWGGGRYIYFTGAYVRRIGYKAAKAELDQIIKNREAQSELSL